MIQTIGFSQFFDAFSEDRSNTFTYRGKRALFDYLEEYEEGTGGQIELDIIALCCEYTEYESALEAMREYQPEDMPIPEDTGVDENGHGMDLVEISEATEKLALEWLHGETQVIEVEGGGVIILDF